MLDSFTGLYFSYKIVAFTEMMKSSENSDLICETCFAACNAGSGKKDCMSPRKTFSENST